MKATFFNVSFSSYASEMNPFVLDVLNKLQVAAPLVILLGCDGTRGEESLVAIGGTMVLAVLLSLVEAHYRKATTRRRALCRALIGVTATVLACGVELIWFFNLNTLHGPIRVYGIPQTVAFLALFFGCGAVLAAWTAPKDGVGDAANSSTRS